MTGAASGIGKAIASALIADGYKVLLSDINEAKLKETVSALGPDASGYVGDVGDPHDIANLAQKALLSLDTIDLVFANAGTGIARSLLDATPEEFDRTFDINAKGAWLTAQAFAKHWLNEGQSGRMCITGSEHSLGFQHTGNGLYTGAKHAILGIADVLNRELPDSITVSVLCPGLVATSIYDHSHVPGVPTSETGRAVGQAMMSQGISPEIVARHAIDRTLAGDFIITTQAVSREGAADRWQAVEAAFAQADLPEPDPEKYRVTDVLNAIRAAYKSRQ